MGDLPLKVSISEPYITSHLIER